MIAHEGRCHSGGNFRKMEESLNALKDWSDDQDESKAKEVSASQSQREDVEEIRSEKAFQPEHNASPEVLYSDMQSAWVNLNATIGAKLKSLGKPFDARFSLGTAVAPLTDSSLPNPLANNDAEFIANLHSQYRRFYRLQSTKEQWLTPDVYSTFMASVAAAKKLIAQTA